MKLTLEIIAALLLGGACAIVLIGWAMNRAPIQPNDDEEGE